MVEPEGGGDLKWQDKHVRLQVDGDGAAFLHSTATFEVVPLPAQAEDGAWELTFEDGVGIVSYMPLNSDGDTEPLLCEYAQCSFKWAAYRSGSKIFVRSNTGDCHDFDTFASLHEEYSIAWGVRGHASPCTFKMFSFTHAFKGARVWLSIADYCKHMKCARKSRASWGSQFISDRWGTWERLVSALGLPCSLRSPAGIGPQAQLTSTKATASPCATTAGLLVVLLRDAYGLQVKSAPSSEAAAPAAQHIDAILQRFAKARSVIVFLDPAHITSEVGGSGFRFRCELFIGEDGMVDMRKLVDVARENELVMKACNIDPNWLVGFGDFVPLKDVLRRCAELRVCHTNRPLLQQLLWSINIVAEEVMAQEIIALNNNKQTTDKCHVQEIDDPTDSRITDRRALRYFKGSRRATIGCKIIGVGLDASRIGMRKRMQLVATVPRKCAFWLPSVVPLGGCIHSTGDIRTSSVIV